MLGWWLLACLIAWFAEYFTVKSFLCAITGVFAVVAYAGQCTSNGVPLLLHGKPQYDQFGLSNMGGTAAACDVERFRRHVQYF
jgi:hypothetical protein